MVSANSHRTRLIEETRSLSTDRLKALADFAAYLREREEWEATAEVLGNKQMARQIRRARTAWNAGRKGSFVSLDELKAKLGV